MATRANVANVTEMKKSDIPLVYRIERGKSPSADELKVMSEIANAKLSTDIEEATAGDQQPGSRFLKFTFKPSETYNPAASGFHLPYPPGAGASSGWRVIAPPYEQVPSNPPIHGYQTASPQSGTMFQSSSEVGNKSTSFMISLKSPVRVTVGVSPCGNYNGLFETDVPVAGVDAAAVFQLAVFQGTNTPANNYASAFRAYSWGGGVTSFAGDFGDLVTGYANLFAPLYFTMEANADYHLFFTLNSWYRNPSVPTGGFLTVGCTVPYFFLQTIPI